jgi:HD-GYP domain-containing protein (c-di-GMP phosphodiesterase class II)/CHASE2 domain-containing sensor protein
MRERLRELAIGAAVAAAAALAIGTHAVAPLQRHAADALMRLAAGRPPPLPVGLPDVAVVAIDPQSLRRFEAWPWPRRLYAEALARLDAAGARVVAFDIDFSTPRDREGDQLFADALGRSGRGVLAAYRQLVQVPGGAELEVTSVPCDPLRGAAAGIGSVLVPVDADGIVRRAPTASSLGGRTTPSLALAALSVAAREPAAPVEPGLIELDYRRAAPAFPVVSIADVIEGRFDPREVAGRIVLVGATAAEFQDLWSTPLGPARPGVFVQAVAVRTLAAARSGAAALSTSGVAAQAALAALVSLAAALFGLGSHRTRLLCLGASAGLLSAGSALLIARAALLVDPVVPNLVLATHYVLGLEGLRSRFGRRLAERELSLATLFRVSEVAVGPPATGALEVALALLGDVIEARALALLRASAPSASAGEGRAVALDGRRIEWRRASAAAAGASGDGGAEPVGDEETARSALQGGRIRIFQGRVPGSSKRGGLAVYVPLYANRIAVGVLVVERDDPRDLDEVQLRTIATVGTQIALSAENLRLLEGLRATFDASVAAIATAIEARDGYTEAHCRRLATYSALMAARLGLAQDEIEAVRLGALLHDVGKIGIRDDVLLKPARFTEAERREMQRHPEIGHRIIERIEGFHPATLDCVRHHHEWWNGSGYPARLAGAAIPLGARIVAVVDVWDALSTDRPYKRALPAGMVRAALEKGKGVQFDPGLVDLFYRVLGEDGDEHD